MVSQVQRASSQPKKEDSKHVAGAAKRQFLHQAKKKRRARQRPRCRLRTRWSSKSGKLVTAARPARQRGEMGLQLRQAAAVTHGWRRSPASRHCERLRKWHGRQAGQASSAKRMNEQQARWLRDQVCTCPTRWKRPAKASQQGSTAS